MEPEHEDADHAANTSFKTAPIKAEVTIDDLNKLDIRVGQIEHADEMPDSKKLVKLTVNFGDHSRIILSGMKQEREDIKALEGMQALFLVNLKPRQLMGEVSQGMILDLGYEDGILPVLAVPEKKVPNGTRLG